MESEAVSPEARAVVRARQTVTARSTLRPAAAACAWPRQTPCHQRFRVVPTACCRRHAFASRGVAARERKPPVRVATRLAASVDATCFAAGFCSPVGAGCDSPRCSTAINNGGLPMCLQPAEPERRVHATKSDSSPVARGWSVRLRGPTRPGRRWWIERGRIRRGRGSRGARRRKWRWGHWRLRAESGLVSGLRARYGRVLRRRLPRLRLPTSRRGRRRCLGCRWCGRWSAGAGGRGGGAGTGGPGGACPWTTTPCSRCANGLSCCGDECCGLGVVRHERGDANLPVRHRTNVHHKPITVHARGTA